LILALGLLLAAIVPNLYPDYQIAEILITSMIFLVMLCPITPDYIHPESYGLANMLKVIMKKVGILTACFA